jgi:hypothetical protein
MPFYLYSLSLSLALTCHGGDGGGGGSEWLVWVYTLDGSAESVRPERARVCCVCMEVWRDKCGSRVRKGELCGSMRIFFSLIQQMSVCVRAHTKSEESEGKSLI